MTEVFSPNEWFRKNFAKTQKILETPPLMRLQKSLMKNSYKRCSSCKKREHIGITSCIPICFPNSRF